MSRLSRAEKRQRARELLARHAAARSAVASPAAEGEALRLVRLIEQRREFPGLHELTYLNYGAHGPLPRPALEALRTAYENLSRWGPFSAEANLAQDRAMSRARRAVAREVGCRPAELAFTENVSTGCNIALWGLDWRAGDELVLTDSEHPSVGATVEELKRRLGIVVTYVPTAEGDETLAERIGRALSPRTRLVVASHVLWGVGELVDLGAIAASCRRASRERPIYLLADGAQAAGVLPVDLEELGVDFYAFSGHKWMCGPAGVAGLYVSPAAASELRPTFLGWRGLDLTAGEGRLELRSDARRYEIGTSGFPLYEAWRSALETHRAWGSRRRRYQRAVALARRLWLGLKRLSEATEGAVEVISSAPPKCGLVAVRLRDARYATLVRWLEGRRILARVMADPHCVRFSVHYLTLASEIDELLEALRQYPFTRIGGEDDISRDR